MNGETVGCKNCPAREECPTIQYRGSACVAARARAGADFDPLTNGESLRRVGDTEFAIFLYTIMRAETPPWCSVPDCEKTSCPDCIQKWLGTPVAAPKGKKEE